MSANDAFFPDNMPPSQSATVPTGSKRKSDNDENCSRSNLKKARVLHNTQEPFQTPFSIPPQLQDPQARPQLSVQIPNQQVQGWFEIPPEIASIKIELNDLISFPVVSSIQLPPCGPLLTTVIAREDVEKIERRFYPYLWFPGRAPYMLQQQDYNNILGQPHAGAMKTALRRVGVDCGTLGLTASHQLVLFFQGEDKKAALDAVAKSMGPNSCQSARWRGAMEIPGPNNVAVLWGQNIQRDAPDGSGSNASQSNIWNHHTEQHSQIELSSYAPPTDSTTQQTLETTTVPPQSQATASHYHPSVDSEASSNSTVSEPSTSSRKRNATPRRPVKNRNTFVHVSDETAKRRRNGPPPDIPILTPLPDSTNTVSGPSTSYPTNTVFAQTHTAESFPHPQNTNAIALSGPKRRPRGRASAKSRAQDQTPTAVSEQSQVQEPGREVTQKSKAQRRKHCVEKTQESEPSQSQAGPSGTRAPAIVPDVPIYPQAQFYGQQVDNRDTLGQGQASLPEPSLAAFESGHNQPQPNHVEFDASGVSNLANLTDQEFSDLITSTSMDKNFAYDSVRQVFYLQSQESQGSAPSFSGPSAGLDFAGEFFNGQPWNFEQLASGFPVSN